MADVKQADGAHGESMAGEEARGHSHGCARINFLACGRHASRSMSKAYRGDYEKVARFVKYLNVCIRRMEEYASFRRGRGVFCA